MALRLRGATSGYIELKAPASAGDNTLTLPTNNGSANTFLKTDGSGNLSWQSNLTFDGTKLDITTSGAGFRITRNSQYIELDGNFGNGGDQLLATSAGFRLQTGGVGNSYERLRITSGGFTHIGLPTITNSWDTHAIALSTNSATFACPATVSIFGGTGYSTANMAGGGIRFVGYYDANNFTTFAHIAGVKENTVSGEYGAALTFHVRQNGGLGEEAARFTSAGNLKFPNGHGIEFSATGDGAGTDTSETLNDYEEGTWNPIFTDDGASGNSASSYNKQLGWYTKIGNLVNVQMRISHAAFSNFNTSHATYIKGLPYVIQQSSDRLTTGTALVSNCNLDSDTMSIGVLSNSGTGTGNSWFRIFQTKDNTAWESIKISQWTSGNNEILANFSYRTDAI